MKRLWCQLALSFTLLTFCAMTLLFIIMYGIDDYKDFKTAVTIDNVEKRVASEKLTILQAIRNRDNPEWWIKARDNIRDKLINIEYGSGTSIYRITNSSIPEVYITVSDTSGKILLSDPEELPPQIAAQFSALQKDADAMDEVVWAAKDGAMWVDMPIAEGDGAAEGRLRILYIARFDIAVQLKSICIFFLDVWRSVFIVSIPIGIACGSIASQYVMRQLHKMNAVTERWRQGNFDARIALPSDDILTLHSQRLNDMAQDLEMFLTLKQHLAVSEERSRVAQELHDTVKQKLFALGLQLATIKTKPAAMEVAGEHVLEAENITREAQHDLMEIITQQRLAGAGDVSLYERIHMLVGDFGRRFGVAVEFSHADPARFPADVEHHVLRIVQESLMNAVRHGKATKIVVTSAIKRDRATVTVVDNGGGFDTSRKTRGFGITSMRERARALPQATLEIDSFENAGTQVTLSWKYES